MLFITALATVAIAFSALVTMALTSYVLRRENRLLRRASTEPEVIAYLNPHRRYGTVLAFVIENVGRGMARNVCCSFEGDKDDFNAHGVNPNVAGHQLPIRLLAPDRRMEWWFGRGQLYSASRRFYLFRYPLHTRRQAANTESTNIKRTFRSSMALMRDGLPKKRWRRR